MPNVLVVDDENEVATYVANELNSRGYTVSTVNDGVEAVLKIADSNWDALLMDIRMPKLDGLNALRIIRRLKPDMPIIMFSGSSSNNEMILSTRLGADTCLLKPVNLDYLLKTLKDLLILK